MKSYITKSPQETKALGKKLAQSFKGGVIALTGELGSGKTTFTQGFAEGLGLRNKIISPTFILVKQYKILNKSVIFFHLDLFRINTKTNFKQLGLSEILENPKNIILIEWAEKLRKLLPKKTVFINFETVDEKTRKITIS